MLEEVLESIGAIDAGWELYEPQMGDESLLEAPDGCVIEQDGECTHGHISPLRVAGMI